MQGKQNVNSERKGPHKSMHCKFCKPPGVVTPEKPSGAQMETKTKLHLVHEAADLRLTNVFNEPGSLPVEYEACLCVLEGENDCPKCLPDKNRPPPKKKVCRCPKGAKPHPNMSDKKTPKEKKPVEEDDEFWWEKYSREHDAIAKETWAAYMAQRRKDKKLEKCQKREEAAVIASKTKGTPKWYQKLSCQQMLYVEFLSTAIRLDSDENITDRTYFVLGGIGLYPRPSRKLLKKCIRYCHYNSIQFLNQLHVLTKDEDPFNEKYVPAKMKDKIGDMYTWNERLIMNSMCYLEFPALLRELMERLPPLPRKQLLPQIPYPVFSKLPKKKYDNPYLEPVWQDRLNWVEKMKIDRLNRCRIYMETKRMKIPPLALVRRPSLIDARPPFLSQIEANERAARRLVKEKIKKPFRKHPISTFNSAVDVTAIAGIEASEISTTDKADTDDICVFLREPKEPESTAGELEGEVEDFPIDKEVRFVEEPEKIEETQVNRMKTFDFNENSIEGEADIPEIPFKTPPKTGSGETIKSPCPPPSTTPGPPTTHYDKGKRELDIINENECGFCLFVTSSTQTVKDEVSIVQEDVEQKLKSAAAKLKKIAAGQDSEGVEKPHKKKKKKCKSKKRKIKKKKKTKLPVIEPPESTIEENLFEEENVEEDEEEGEEMEEYGECEGEEECGLRLTYKKKRTKDLKESDRESEFSDPDPDTDDEWTRPPCTPEEVEEKLKEKPKKKKRRRKGKKLKSKYQKKKNLKPKFKEEKKNRLKQKESSMYTVQGSKSGQSSLNKTIIEEQKDTEKTESDVFRGEVEPLVQEIIKDLAEEGFYCAAYPLLYKHPDVDQLVLHLKGEILTKKLREKLRYTTKGRWDQMKGLPKFLIGDLGISAKRLSKADWNDKLWISRLAKSKIDEFYYKVANTRAIYGKELYDTLYQSHFGSERYLKIFYAYMISKYEDAILRGIS